MMKYFIFCTLLLSLSFVSAQSDEEVEILVEGGSIFGTLHTADTNSKTALVFIIAGSGPSDRNLSPGNVYKSLADSLSSHGISSFRYDKRIAGKSVKSFSSLHSISFEDIINDARSCLKYVIEQDKFSSITIIGHSQGSTVGMVIARENGVNKYISLAGPGEKINHILKKQIYDTPANEAMLKPHADPIFENLEKGIITDTVHPMLMSIFNPVTQRFLMDWMRYDPVVELNKLNIPVLIINGTTDFQVPVDQAELLYASNLLSQISIIENMNHVMRDCDTIEKFPNMMTYNNEALGLNKECVRLIVGFSQY